MVEYRNADGLTEKEFLEQYKPADYERPSVTVDMLLFTVDSKPTSNIRVNSKGELKILMIKRKNHPYIHKWALPGGFVDINENVTDAAYRELKEETNIDGVYMEQLFTFGDVGRDPRMRVISASHMALVPKDSVKPVAGDDAEEVAWFTVDKKCISETENERTSKLYLHNESSGQCSSYTIKETVEINGKIPIIKSEVIVDSEEHNVIAFDHIKQINMALDRLRNKVEYTPIAFNLLPEEFSMSDVQDIYEILLSRELVKQNFRVKIAKYIEESDKKQDKVGHRPAKLYKLKKLNINSIG